MACGTGGTAGGAEGSSSMKIRGKRFCVDGDASLGAIASVEAGKGNGKAAGTSGEAFALPKLVDPEFASTTAF